MYVIQHLEYVWRGCGDHSMWVWSLNHCIINSFDARKDRGFQPNSKTWDNKFCGNSMMEVRPIFLSTQHMNDVKHLVCMKRMWWPFHVSLEPESMHHDFIWCRAVTQDFIQIQKLGTTIFVQTAWLRSNPCIQSIWMMSNTLSMYEEDVKTIPCGSDVSINASWLDLVQNSHPQFQPNSKTRDNKFSGKSRDPIFPSTAYEWCNTMHMYEEDVAIIPCESGASIIASWL